MKNPLEVILIVLLIFSCQLIQGQDISVQPTKVNYNLLTARLDSLSSDTITSGSQIYHPLYVTYPIWYELGNLGLPALPACWTGISRLNEPSYIRTVMQYASKSEELSFYESKSPFAMLTYTSGGSQDVNGQVINAVFARHISPNLKVLANLDFINSEGHYTNQKSSHSDFSINADYHKGRYEITAGVESLSFSMGENGGLQETEFTFPWTDNPASKAVNLSGAASSINWTIVKGRQEFDFLAPPPIDTVHDISEPSELKDFTSNMDSLSFDPLFNDSIVESKLPFDSTQSILQDLPVISDTLTRFDFCSKPKLVHLFNYSISKRLYKDVQSNESDYYSQFFIDTTQAEDSLVFKTFSNKFGLTHSGAIFDSLKWSGMAGADHNIVSWTSNNYSGLYQQFGFFVNVSASNSKWFANIDGRFNALGYAVGSYDIRARLLKNKSNSSINWGAEFSSILDLPSIFHQAFSGNHDRWLLSTTMQGEQKIGLYLNHSDLNISGGANLNMISNWAYFDEFGVSKQSSKTTLLLSGFIQKHFKVGPFNSSNRVYVQYTPAVEIPLPLLVASSSTYMHHDIYFQKTNGKLEVEYGIDLRYSTSYDGYAYRPSSGAFHLQSTQTLGNYPYLDLFLTLRVKRTRVFIKYEHVNQGITGENFFPVPYYPVKVRYVKYGVYWHFYD